METPREVKSNNSDLLELHPLHFQNYLEFIYTGNTVINMSNAIPLLNVSMKYRVTELGEKCRAFLGDVTTGESLEVLQQIILYRKNKESASISEEIISLEETVLKNICSNAYTLMESSEFLQLNQDTIQKILEIDELRVFGELQVFRAVIRWGKAESLRQKLSPTPNNIRNVLLSSLPYLRFPTMDPSDFSLYVASTGLLTTDEIISILLYFNIADSKRHLAPEGTFSFRPRKWIAPIGTEHAIERLSYCGWNECIDLQTNLSTGNWFMPQTPEPHSIRLKIDHSIWITSIGMNCPYDIIGNSGTERFEEFVVKVKVEIEKNQVSNISKKIIGTTEEIIFGENIHQYETYSVKFEDPVYIEENIWHTVYFTILDSGNYRGTVYTTRNGSDGRFIEYIAGNNRIFFEFENNKSNDSSSFYTGTIQGFIPTVGFKLSS